MTNDATSIAHWLREMPPGALIAMESTGRYHGLLAHLASQAGLVYVLNARDVYFYARALGTRAKTDGVDAGVIARYLAEHHEHLHPWRPASSVQQRLQDLLTRRAQLATQRSGLKQIVRDVDVRDIGAGAVYEAFDALLDAMDDCVADARDYARSRASVRRTRPAGNPVQSLRIRHRRCTGGRPLGPMIRAPSMARVV
ncbi:IS110 family transposase [Variovorax sp. RO1]|uniref:IS110 family transposase n=1 Tax=Variovorax sp. RO1 TaxID=2066034 RepID=UPI0015DF94D1|nr:transposase [Variovorax sp. RO1]